MSVATQRVSADDLDHFPNDGKRREVIGGELYVSPAPARTHQELSMVLSFLLFQAFNQSGAGRAFAYPVDVRFSEDDQVQPDLLAIRSDRLDIYQGHIVNGAPDIVIEILSPSSRHYDEVEKKRLYEINGVPEYWIVDPAFHQVTIYQLRDGEYAPTEPVNGLFKSTAVVEFILDPAALFGMAESK
jgi:Uma2 family endonuclease